MSRSQMEKDIIEAEKKLDRASAPSPTKDKWVYRIIRIIALVILLGFLAAVFVVPWLRGVVR